jgi:hypothetical protein
MKINEWLNKLFDTCFWETLEYKKRRKRNFVITNYYFTVLKRDSFHLFREIIKITTETLLCIPIKAKVESKLFFVTEAV